MVVLVAKKNAIEEKLYVHTILVKVLFPCNVQSVGNILINIHLLKLNNML